MSDLVLFAIVRMAETDVGSVKGKEKGSGKRWILLIGAIAAVLLAVVVAVFLNTQNSSISEFTGKICNCRQAEQQKYIGIVEDCCCDYETVNRLNTEVLNPLLQDLVKTPFYRYFKVKLWCDCPFWPDDGMCRLRDCSVCECPESEFPEVFKKPLSQYNPVCQEGKPQATVDRTLDTRAFRGWTVTDNPWTSDDETDNDEMTYVNLRLNPERYTGYIGPSARRIWEAIYSENCPKHTSEGSCQEEKILYKLVSGLHSSISVHIASDYLLDEATNLWGQNLTLLYDRVLRYPDRVQNLYFTFLFVLRAVTKAEDYLGEAEYETGNVIEDLKTKSLVKQVVSDPKTKAACPVPFDEAKLWKGQRGPELKQQLEKQFRNISAIMDCVGCEKCRLWGKLQILGLGTALKILFTVNGEDNLRHNLELQRNEVIALMNLLHRLSESVKYVHDMSPAAERIAGGHASSGNSFWQRIVTSIAQSKAVSGKRS